MHRPLSSVAGILEKGGGVRTVVTERWRMRFHVGDGERLFVVPGYFVTEPVPWDDIPRLIERVRRHVKAIVHAEGKCGDCNACWRINTHFECLWRKSQAKNDRMADELRPDRCGAMLAATDDPLAFVVHGKPNAAANEWIEEMRRLGYLARKAVGG